MRSPPAKMAGYPQTSPGSPPDYCTSQPTLGSWLPISSQLVTLQASTGRPRLDWVWVWGGDNPDLHGAAGSTTQPGSWGLPRCRGMLSSLMLLKPGYNYLLQADRRDSSPTLDSTQYIYSVASDVSGTRLPPKLHCLLQGRPPPPACLNVAILPSLGHSYPDLSSPGDLSCL